MVASLDYFSYVAQDEAFQHQVRRVRTKLLRGARIRRPSRTARCCDAPFARQSVPSDFCNNIVANQTDYEVHLAQAISHEHPFNKDAYQDLPEDLAASVDVVVQKGKFMVQWRRKQFTILRQVSRAVSHITEALKEHQSRRTRFAHLVASDFNFGLLAVLIDATGWPHDSLLFNLVFGFNIIGDIPDTGLFREGGQPFRADLYDTIEANADYTSNLIDNGERNKTLSADDVSVWSKTISEVEKGFMLGPYTRKQLDHEDMFGYGKWRPLPRFAVWQKGKLRACDDARRSLTNNITRTFESLVCDRADFPVKMAKIFSSMIPQRISMMLGTDDIEAAYRRIPVSQPQYSTVACKDGEGKMKFFIVPGHNFGLLASVLNFNSVPEFTVHVARRMLGVCCSHFYDDFPVCEPSFSCRSAQNSLGALHKLLGLPFSAEKHVACDFENPYLGVHNDFSRMRSHDELRVRVTDSRRAALIELLTECIDDDVLSPSQAESLHGKLQFALSGAFGKVGRSALLLIRERFKRSSASDALNKALRFALHLLRDIVKSAPDFIVSTLPSKGGSTLIWSDAMYNESAGIGQLGWVLRVPPTGERAAIYRHSSLKLNRVELERLFGVRRNYIGQLETLAALSVYMSADPSMLRDKMIMHFVDNQGALSNLISCSSRDYDCAWMVHEFAIICSSLSCRVWLEYVRSAANVADLPSRGEFGYLRHELKSESRPMRIPHEPRWTVP